MTDMTDARPCRLCGGTDIAFSENGRRADGTYLYWQAACNDCDVIFHPFDTRDEALAAWNKIAAPEPVTEWRTTTNCYAVVDRDVVQIGRKHKPAVLTREQFASLLDVGKNLLHAMDIASTSTKDT